MTSKKVKPLMCAWLVYYVAARHCCGFSILGRTDSLESAEGEGVRGEKSKKNVFVIS